MRRFVLGLSLAAGLACSSGTHAECKAGIFDLPITIEGREAVTTLKVNGQEARFTVDTGAFFSVITPGWANQLGLRPFSAPYGFEIRGVGGTVRPQVVTVKNLGISGAPLNNMEFLVDDNEVGHAGLLGQNILGMLDAEYDFAHARMALVDVHGCEGRNLAYWIKPGVDWGAVQLEPIDNPLQRRIVGRIRVNGVPMRALFDTGAGSSVLNVTAARRAGVPLEGEGVTAGGLSRGIGQRFVPTRVSPVREVAIDTEVIRNTRIQVGDLGIGYDLLIGADFFLAHRVFVSNHQHKLFFTYAGGPVFNLTPPREATGQHPTTATVEADPTDAAGWARRASVRAARQDYAGAKTDLDQAIATSPSIADYHLQRARSLLALKRIGEAQADLDAAAALSPADADVRLLRARVLIERKAYPEARSDLTAAEASLAPQSDDRYLAASLRLGARDPVGAVAGFDTWLRFHPLDNRRNAAVLSRCWARVQAGTELYKAQTDCDAAHRAMPRSERVLVVRAFLKLRQGARDAAKADLDAAMAIDAKAAARDWISCLQAAPWANEAAGAIGPKTTMDEHGRLGDPDHDDR